MALKIRKQKSDAERKNLEIALAMQREELELQAEIAMIDNLEMNNIDFANIGGPNPDNMTYEQ